MECDMHHNVKEEVALDLQAISTDTTTVGNIIDTLGYESIEFISLLGTITDGTYTFKIEDGDDSGLSDAADVPADQLLSAALPAYAATDDDTAKRTGVITKKRYVRLSIVSAGTTTGVNMAGAVAVLGDPKHRPVADSA